MSHWNTINYKLKENKRYFTNKTRGTFAPIFWCSMNVIYCSHQYWSSLLNLVTKATSSMWRARNIGLAYIATPFTNLLGDVKCKCDYILNVNFIKVFCALKATTARLQRNSFSCMSDHCIFWGWHILFCLLMGL